MSTPHVISPESALVPVRTPRTVSRRAMLGGLGLGSLSMLVAPLFGLAPTAAAEPSRPKATPKPTGTGYAPLAPYTVQASCQLTEDYFLTDEVLIDLEGGDQIMPFTTQAGTVEAIVLTGAAGTNRQVAHLAHNPATISGWSYTVITTGLDHVGSAAVYGTAGAQPQLVVGGFSGVVSQLVRLQNGAQGWSTVDHVAATPGTLKSGVGPGGQFFYGWGTGTSGSTVTLTVTVYDATHPSGATVLTHSYTDDPQFDDVVMRYDPQGKAGWIVASGSGLITKATQTGITSFTNPATDPVSTPDLDTLLGAYGAGPDIVWQDTAGQVNITKGGAQITLGATSGSSSSSVATWTSNDLYRFAFCLDQTISMISQLPPALPIVYPFTPAIPMLPGVARVFAVDTDPSESTLFCVGLDASLGVLSYGPTGWTQSVVHQASAVVQEVTSWQCAIAVTDANGVAVPGAGVQLSTDRPAALWQEGETTGTVTTLLPGTPSRLTCDGAGQLIVALPTDELDAAQLSAQALDGNGSVTGKPLAIAPDTDVQAFLAGTGGLDSIGMLTGDHLTTAQNTSWNTASQSYISQGPLFPALARLSGSQQQDAATAVAAAMTHLASLPATTPAAVSDVRSACLDLTSAAATFATSSDPNHFTSSASGDQTWWQKAGNDVKSAFHGLRHGGIHLAKLISSWDDDAKNWALNLVVTLEDDAKHVMNFVVHTAKEAIHAISSLVHALGADIEKFWHWLKNLVLGILAAAEKGAKVMEAWIGQLTDQLLDTLDHTEQAVDGFFGKLTDTVDGWIDDLKKRAGVATFGSSAPLPPPGTDTGSSNADINWKDAEDLLKAVQHASPMYWLNKLKKYLPKNPSDGGPSFSLDLTQVVSDVQGDVTKAADTITATFDLISESFRAIFASKSSTTQTPLSTILDDLENAADNVLTFLDDVIDTVLDLLKAIVTALDQFFSYEFQAVPVIGGLLDRAGIDTKISIKHITCLIAAFPTAVIYRAMGYQGDMFPPQTDDEKAVRRWAEGVHAAVVATHPSTKLGDSFFTDPWGASLNLPSALVQMGWTVNDMEVDADRGTTLTTIVDIAAPTLLNILQWPSKPISDSLSGWPFRGGIDTTSTDWGIVPALILGEFAPPLSNFVCLVLEKDPGGAHNLYSGYNGYVNPAINGVAGIVCAVLGGVWSGVNDEGLAVAEAVIGNVSYILSFAGMTPWADDPYVKAAKVIGDTVANSCTAGLILDAFVDAAQ